MPGLKYNEREKHELEEFLKKVDEQRNSSVVSQALILIYRAFGRTRLDDIESSLRTINANTFLIAIPYSFDATVASKLPDGNEEYPYYLWVGVNGEKEAEEKYNELKTTKEENLAKLEQTGYLIQRGTPGNN